MSVDCFLHTNVLVYAATGTPAERTKRERAQALIATANFGISTQILEEFYVVATRKARIKMPPEIALDWMEQLDGPPRVVIDPDIVKLAAAISIRYQISPLGCRDPGRCGSARRRRGLLGRPSAQSEVSRPPHREPVPLNPVQELRSV